MDSAPQCGSPPADPLVQLAADGYDDLFRGEFNSANLMDSSGRIAAQFTADVRKWIDCGYTALEAIRFAAQDMQKEPEFQNSTAAISESVNGAEAELRALPTDKRDAMRARVTLRHLGQEGRRRRTRLARRSPRTSRPLARRRGAGRPRASASRSSARSGDSPSDPSDEPEPPELRLRRHDRWGLVSRQLAVLLGRIGGWR